MLVSVVIASAAPGPISLASACASASSSSAVLATLVGGVAEALASRMARLVAVGALVFVLALASGSGAFADAVAVAGVQSALTLELAAVRGAASSLLASASSLLATVYERTLIPSGCGSWCFSCLSQYFWEKITKTNELN